MFWAVSAGWWKSPIPNAVTLLDFQSKSTFFRCSAGPKLGRRLYTVCFGSFGGAALAALYHCAGAVALVSWCHGIVELWCRAYAMLVFINCMTTQPWGQLRLSSLTMFVREHSRALGLQRYEYCRYSDTVQLRRYIMGYGLEEFFCFLLRIPIGGSRESSLYMLEGYRQPYHRLLQWWCQQTHAHHGVG
jgi:hypothetical protein